MRSAQGRARQGDWSLWPLVQRSQDRKVVLARVITGVLQDAAASLLTCW